MADNEKCREKLFDCFNFDEQSNLDIATILPRYPEQRKASAVLYLLYIAQNQVKRQTGKAWLPRPAIDCVAKRLEMPPIRVYEIASFYTMFNKNPIGRYHLQVCTAISCWLRGAGNIVAACKEETGISEFEQTSVDGLFTLSEVGCLGACANAPVLQIDDDYYEDLNDERTRNLLKAFRRGDRPQPGPTVNRLHSAPIGKVVTLSDKQNQGKSGADPSVS